MIRLFTLFFILILSASSTLSGNYTISSDLGNDPYMYYFRGSAQHVFPPPADDKLSVWQDMPFEWDFFGQKVNGLYISDNGYITFDGSAEISVPDNTSLPNDDAPKNAIFAYWTNLHTESGFTQWSNEICISTVGSAPKREFIIYWMGVVPAFSTYNEDNFSFAICLHESGGFDIVYSVSRCGKVLKATAGACNADGSAFIMVDGSPELNFPTCGFGDADDVCYHFSYGTASVNSEESMNDIINIYPNPATEIININSFDRLFDRIDIISYSGEIIKTINTMTESRDLSIKIKELGIAAGIYGIRFHSNEGIITKRIIIL